ncbi:apolipoprotein A-II [Eucyclogobius newberryi]|uniref:apolipoprotein A-II n=1 Tax=Eucyclogobius newberryi TaxID=166745 RepID=UPI003B5A073B
MNAKFVFAVFLALQVSLSLCEIPAPDADLVDKYNDMKTTFFSRLANAYKKLTDAANNNENAMAAKETLTNLQSQGPLNMEAFNKAMQGVAEEMSPAVDQARSAVLGVYSAYLRPYVGEYLQDSINRIKVVLDQVLPAEN